MLEEPTVTSLERAERPAAWAEPSVPLRFILDTTAIARSELRKVSRDPVEVFTRAVQPILWLVIFGQVMSSLRAIPTGSLSYLDYLAPGILAQSALFSSIFYGIAVIWERDLGIVHKLLVSPASRTALVSGKALAGGVRAIVQAVIVTLVAALIGIHLRVDLVSDRGGRRRWSSSVRRSSRPFRSTSPAWSSRASGSWGSASC